MVSINCKRGDSFILECVCSVNSLPQDIAGWTITSKVRHTGLSFVDELVVTKTDATNGVFQLKKQDTTLWPTKTILCDIQYVINGSGQVISTETFEILVIADITY